MTEARRDRRADRHAATKREILDAAWQLSRERGLTGWALRDLADAVAMRTPSLYVYFDSKNALFDAMFADGNAELLGRVERAVADVERRRVPPPEVLRIGARLFFDFCVEDPARHQLLFLRTIPGFQPSGSSYALAGALLERQAAVLAAAGVGGSELVDLWTALLSGLVAQQLSNDPGGDRWRRLLDPAIDMFVTAHVAADQP